MARKRYLITHSNFVLKSKHQTTTGGTIFERDYMTIGSSNGFAPGQVPIYGESSFKMTIRNDVSGQLKHRYGNWSKRDGICEEYENKDIWTLNCLGSETISSDSKIVLKPNYTSLLDFAYYGSAVELIRVSISDIINKFPAELFLSDTQMKYFKSKEDIRTSILGGEEKYVVENPFNIDLYTKSIANIDVENPLRYFCESYTNYAVYDKDDNKISDIDWKITYTDNKCPQNGDLLATVRLTDEIILYYYYLNGKKILLHDSSDKNIHIRPNEIFLEKFFNELDDFETLLLNRQSKPIYRAILDTPVETDTGVYVSKKSYVWPVLNGWNLDISSLLYTSYLNDLIKVAQFYDDYYTDNLWRSLTHESIKNLDFTYKKENSNEAEEDYIIGTSRLEGMFKAYGRQFDDIKRYIDNIKTLNTVTYNKRNNLPDYFLTDSLELAGWDVVNVMPTQDTSIVTDVLYSGESKGYDANDANNEFLRRLKLNSSYIFSTKGTKNSIETMLSLFGLKKYDEVTGKGDYTISEYVAVAKEGFDKASDVEKFNELKKDFFYESSEGYADTDTLQGLPVRMVIVHNNETNEDTKYIIPWFDKLQKIDGRPYFQMKGGWGKRLSKKIDLEIAPDVKEIVSTDNVKLYEETSKYLNIVRNLDELKNLSLQKINDGDIYYVYDITDFNEQYHNKRDDKDSTIKNTDISHYFILKDINYSNRLGYYYSEDNIEHEGWINVKETVITDPNNLTDDGIRVLYVESIVDDNTGNNPHVGFGKYDDGNEYLEFFRKLFKYSIENDNFTENAYDCDTGDLMEGINTAGFKLDSYEDSMKCWFFTDTNNPKYSAEDRKSLIPHEIEYGECGKDNYCGYNLNNNDKQFEVNVGKSFIEPTYLSELEPTNPENGKSYDEAAANSIINIKALKLKFVGNITKEYDPKTGNSFKDYLYNKIMPYVKQLIPSTTIFEIEIDDKTKKEK